MMSETYTVRIEPLERDVECRADQAILDACLRAGVWLPHACTHGTCGTCKVQVVDGQVEHNDASDFALWTASGRKAGPSSAWPPRPRTWSSRPTSTWRRA